MAANDPLHVPLMDMGDSAAAVAAGRVLANDFDSDGFFRAVYSYWRQGGLRRILLRRAADLLAALLLLQVMLVAWGAVDYSALRDHLRDRRCPNGALNDAGFFRADCYGHRPVHLRRLLSPPLGLAFVAAVCGALWLWALVSLVKHVRGLLYMRAFVRDNLHLRDRDLHVTPWPDVEGRLLQTRRAQDMLPVSGGSRTISALHVVNCITRRANFAIDLYRPGGPLALRLPGLGPFLPLSLQRALDAALAAVVYDRRGGTTPRAHNRAAVAALLRRRLRRQALVQLALLPALLVAHLAYLAFRHIHDFRARPAALLQRGWANAARWHLRRYCELDHLLDMRLRCAAPQAAAYLAASANPDLAILRQLAQVVIGALVAMLCSLAFVYDEEFLLASFTPGRSVAFVLAVLGSLAATVAPPAAAGGGDVDDPHAAFSKLADALGGDPPHAWHMAPGASATTGEVRCAFRHVLVNALVEEVLGILTAPILLGLVLPERAEDVVDAFIALRRSPAGLGDVCVHALLGGGAGLSGDSGGVANPRVLSSLVHFQRAHPAYAADAQQQTLLASYNGTTQPFTEFSVVISSN